MIFIQLLILIASAKSYSKIVSTRVEKSTIALAVIHEKETFI